MHGSYPGELRLGVVGLSVQFLRSPWHHHQKSLKAAERKRADLARADAGFASKAFLTGPTFELRGVPSLHRAMFGPKLRDIVGADNVPFHNVAGVEEAIQAVGASLRCLAEV